MSDFAFRKKNPIKKAPKSVIGGPRRMPSPVRVAAIFTALAVIVGWSFFNAIPASAYPLNLTPTNDAKPKGPGKYPTSSP